MSKQEARQLGKEVEAKGFRYLGIMTYGYGSFWVDVIDPRTNERFCIYNRAAWEKILAEL